MYAIGVDKSGLLVREVESATLFQAIQNRRKKLLRPLPDSARVGLLRSQLLQSFSYWKARFGGFFFLGHRDSFSSYAVDRPESEWPRWSLPE